MGQRNFCSPLQNNSRTNRNIICTLRYVSVSYAYSEAYNIAQEKSACHGAGVPHQFFEYSKLWLTCSAHSHWWIKALRNVREASSVNLGVLIRGAQLDWRYCHESITKTAKNASWTSSAMETKLFGWCGLSARALSPPTAEYFLPSLAVVRLRCTVGTYNFGDGWGIPLRNWPPRVTPSRLVKQTFQVLWIASASSSLTEQWMRWFSRLLCPADYPTRAV